MVEAALLANYLCNHQPRSVRSGLLHDEAFGERFGLVPLWSAIIVSSRHYRP
jgi:hypothetical protein